MPVQLHHTQRTLIAGMTLALLLGGTAACQPGTSSVKSTPDRTDTATSSSAAKQGSTAKVGDTISLKGMDGLKMAVTVLKVVPTAKGKDDTNVPDAGKRFFAVQFSLKNVGAHGYDDSPSNGAQIFDSEGQEYDADIAEVAAGPSLSSALKLGAGSMSKGYIVFQVPKKATITKIQFALDSGIADQAGEWKLG